MKNTIGFRECEKSLQLGLMFTPQQALKINLVDKLTESNDLISQAELQMNEWLKIPSEFRKKNKKIF
jgi:ClpP class serine protease